MQYCPPNVTLNEVWINHGTSQCFMETLTVSITAGLLLLFGSAQLWMYRKYGTQVTQSSLPRSKLYYAQIFITLLLPVVAVLRFILQATVLNGGLVCGYMVSMVNGLC
jgi:nitrate reductase gamma subunit